MKQLSANSFDYSALDNETVSFLQSKELNMRSYVNDFAPKMGMELKEAQDELAQRGYGCFEEWYTSLGLTKRSVYNYLNAYSFVQQLHEQGQDSVANAIPANLMYEAGRKSAHPEAVQSVVNGEITTQKEFKELESRLKAQEREKAEAERRAREAEERAAKAEQEKQHWQGVAKNQPVRVETKTVEVVPDSIKRELQTSKYKIEGLERSLEQTKKSLESAEAMKKIYEKDSKEYKELKSKIEFLHREKDDLHRQIESATALSGLAVKIDHFLKTELSPIRYSRALERLDSEVAVKNLTDILSAVEHWCEDMRRYIPQNNRKVVIDYDPAG